MNSIKHKILGVLAIVLVLNVIGGIVVYRGLSRQKADGVVINLAGAQRMLSQKMTKEVLLLSDDPSATAAVNASVQRFHRVLAGLLAGDAELRLPPCTSPAIRARLEQVNQRWTPFKQAVETVVANPANSQAARGVILAQNTALLDEMNAAVTLFEEQAESKVAGMLRLQILVIGGAIVIGISLGLVLSRLLSRPLTLAVQALECVAEGDLTQEIAVTSKDEVGQIALAVNRAVAGLRHTLIDVRTAASTVAIAAQEIASASDSLSRGTQTQTASLEQTASGLEEMTGIVKQNAESARKAQEIGATSRSAADHGVEIAGQAVQAMNEMNAAAHQIGEITGTVNEIAFQTNLLALNAAVEAARAGAEGRGFAVVAAEVRSLAHRSASSSKEIKALIGNSVDKVEQGSVMVTRSGDVLKDILGTVGQVTTIMSDIARSTVEQSSSIDQLNRAMSQIDRVMQTNAAQTEQLSATAQNLSQQATRVLDLVSRFRVDSNASLHSRNS